MIRIARPRCGAAVAIALALLSTGCAGGGGPGDMTTQSTTLNSTSAATPVPTGKGRLVLSRPTGILYAASAATVKVNGDKVADLYGGNSHSVDVAPGNVTVSVDAWNYPGSWTEQLTVAAGTTYQIEVAPREDGVGTAVIFGAIGGAIEAQNNPKAGLFQWKLTSQAAPQVVAAAPTTAPKQTKAIAKSPAKSAAAAKKE